MSNVAQVSTDVNTDEIPFYDEVWDRRTDEPIDTPLRYLMEARDREDHAARWGFWVYDALVGKWGSSVAGRAAKATYERLRRIDNLDAAFEAMPYYEFEPAHTFWRGE